jgi:hypothetical protein
MISTRTATRGSTASKQATAQIIKSFHAHNAGLRPTFITVQHFQLAPAGQRHFSSSPNSPIKEFFEKKSTEKVRKTHAAWPHPGMSNYGMDNLTVSD